MDLENERVLVEQAQRDPQAFRQLYAFYFPKLYAYVRYRVGKRQDAEDLVGETFLRVVAELGKFRWRAEGSFAAWIFRIAHNLVSNFYRQQRIGKNVTWEEMDEIPDNTLLLEELAVQQEQSAYILKLVGTLSARRQEVITLKFFGGLQNREIAQVLGLDERTVASHLCRGLEDLQRKMLAEAQGLEIP